MQILTRNMVAMNRWGGEEKGNLITSLVAVGSLACGNNASGTKGSLCSASGRQIAKNAVAVMVIQVFSGSFDICQVPKVQCTSRQEHLDRLSCSPVARSGLCPLVESHSQSFENGSAEWGRKGPPSAVRAHHACSLELGSGSVRPPPQNWPVLFEQLGEPRRVANALS